MKSASTQKHCRVCGVLLERGKNISESQWKQYNWICKTHYRDIIRAWEGQHHEELLEWHRRWDRKHRLKGSPQYNGRQEAKKKRLKERRTKLVNMSGGICQFGNHPWHLRFHKKDGKEHRSWMDVEKNPKDFVLLCEACHRHVHWCMDFLGLKWDDIVQLNCISRLVKVPKAPNLVDIDELKKVEISGEDLLKAMQ
jgi:hypothetical protein